MAGEAVHVVLSLKAQIHDRAALTRAARAALEREWGPPDGEDRRALADPARALYELLWASHPTAGPRRAEALGFEVVDSSYETHDAPAPSQRPRTRRRGGIGRRGRRGRRDVQSHPEGKTM